MNILILQYVSCTPRCELKDLRNVTPQDVKQRIFTMHAIVIVAKLNLCTQCPRALDNSFRRGRAMTHHKAKATRF